MSSSSTRMANGMDCRNHHADWEQWALCQEKDVGRLRSRVNVHVQLRSTNGNFSVTGTIETKTGALSSRHVSFQVEEANLPGPETATAGTTDAGLDEAVVALESDNGLATMSVVNVAPSMSVPPELLNAGEVKGSAAEPEADAREGSVTLEGSNSTTSPSCTEGGSEG